MLAVAVIGGLSVTPARAAVVCDVSPGVVIDGNTVRGGWATRRPTAPRQACGPPTMPASEASSSCIE